MPSADERAPAGSPAERGTPSGRTLKRQLTLTLAIASALAAVLATGAAMVLADRLVARHVERSASDAVATLAAELAEDPGLASDIEEEARELGIDMRVAVTRDGRLVSGDAGIPRADDRPCVEDPGTGDRVCRGASPSDPALVVFAAAPAERVTAHRGPFVLAAASVMLVVIAASGLVGAWLARRFLAPLDRLRDAVMGADASAPAAVDLPPVTGLDELDALRSALASLLERLDAELQRTRRFAAHAAHELRTPLTKIGVELELLAEAARDEAGSERGLTRVRDTAARLERLTERLLLLATPREALRTEQGASVSELADTTPDRLATDVARLRIDTPGEDGLVRGDPVLLAAMLDNVVDNALKYSDGPVRIRVREDAAAGLVTIEVDDEGPGVPAERAHELFEPFARDPSATRRPGHGLGLALSAHVADAYGGTIGFVPGRPAGSRVRIELPLAGHDRDATSS